MRYFLSMYSLVHGKSGRLAVGFAAMVAAVGFGVCVHHVVLVQTGVLGETLPTALHCTNIRLLSCRNNSHL